MWKSHLVPFAESEHWFLFLLPDWRWGTPVSCSCAQGWRTDWGLWSTPSGTGPSRNSWQVSPNNLQRSSVSNLKLSVGREVVTSLFSQQRAAELYLLNVSSGSVCTFSSSILVVTPKAVCQLGFYQDTCANWSARPVGIRCLHFKESSGVSVY